MDNNIIKDAKTEYAVSSHTSNDLNQFREWLLSFYKISNHNSVAKTLPGVRSEVIDAFLASWKDNEQVYRALKAR